MRVIDTERFKDFRSVLSDLVNKRVRVSFFTDSENARTKTHYGRITSINDHCLVMEADPQSAGEVPLETTHFNLGAVVIFAVDEIPEDADLTEEEERKFQHVKSGKSVSWDELDEWLDKGYIIHETFEETVTLFLYDEGREDGESVPE